MNKTILRWYPLVLPVILLLLLEGAFRLGLWEFLAKPQSHSGQVIALKRNIERYSLGAAPITDVALGNSTTVFGLNHRAMEKELARADRHYVSAAIPGSHLTALRTQFQWLQSRLPSLETVVLGLNAGDTNRVFNGYYERNLVLPLCDQCTPASIAQTYPPEREKQESYGSLSHVLSYREDVGEALLHPIRRIRELSRARQRAPEATLLFDNQSTDHLCGIPLHSVEACQQALSRPKTVNNPHALRTMRLYCSTGQSGLSDREIAAQDEWITWITSVAEEKSVHVLLMPEHPLFRGRWQPLADRLMTELAARDIPIRDLRDVTSKGHEAECSYWRDLVHLNGKGAAIATGKVLAAPGNIEQ